MFYTIQDKTVTTYFDMPAMVKAQGVSSLGQLKCECGVGVIPLTHGEDVKVDDQVLKKFVCVHVCACVCACGHVCVRPDMIVLEHECWIAAYRAVSSFGRPKTCQA